MMTNSDTINSIPYIDGDVSVDELKATVERVMDKYVLPLAKGEKPAVSGDDFTQREMAIIYFAWTSAIKRGAKWERLSFGIESGLEPGLAYAMTEMGVPMERLAGNR